MVYSDDLDYVKIGCDWHYAYEIACKIRALGYDAEIEEDPIFGWFLDGEWRSFYN